MGDPSSVTEPEIRSLAACVLGQREDDPRTDRLRERVMSRAVDARNLEKMATNLQTDARQLRYSAGATARLLEKMAEEAGE